MSGIYEKAKEQLLQAGLNLSSLDLKVVLIDVADYAVDLVNHDFLDDVAVAARVATSGNLTSKTFAQGVFDAADITIAAVTGDVSEALIIYYDSGAAATSRLICYIDAGTGLPFTPNGGDLTIAWDAGANKIFKL